MVAKLGRIEATDPAPATTTATRQDDFLPAGFDLEFRNEVTELVHEILKRSYVTQRESTHDEARRWGLTTEQLVAAAVAHHVMTKVDREYV